MVETVNVRFDVSASSMIVTATLRSPELEYVCEPVTVNEPLPPAIVPDDEPVSSPQSMAALKSPDAADGSGTVNVATTPSNGRSSVALVVTGAAVIVRSSGANTATPACGEEPSRKTVKSPPATGPGPSVVAASALTAPSGRGSQASGPPFVP